MEANLAGFSHISTVDWYGNSVASVFFMGCTLGCNDCQNKKIRNGSQYIDVDKVKDMILEAEPLISGVVFTGGEPCEQVEPLEHLIIWCKSRNLKTFIHTSGNKPEELKRVLSLVDGVRIDYKPVEQFQVSEDEDKQYRYKSNFITSLRDIQDKGINYWVSAVILNNSNRSLIEEKRTSLDKLVDAKHIIIVQGNEKHALSPNEMTDLFDNCYICTRQNGLQWIPKRMEG